VGGAHGRTPDLLPSSRRRDPEQAQPAKHPMPISRADWRAWALVYARIGVVTAGGQQPAAVGALTDADTVPSSVHVRVEVLDEPDVEVCFSLVAYQLDLFCPWSVQAAIELPWNLEQQTPLTAV